MRRQKAAYEVEGDEVADRIKACLTGDLGVDLYALCVVMSAMLATADIVGWTDEEMDREFILRTINENADEIRKRFLQAGRLQ